MGNVHSHETTKSFDRQVQNLKNEIDSYLQKIINDFKGLDIYEPIRDALTGGKRIRAIIILLANEVFSGPQEEAMKIAGAIEVLHAGSLVHDDIMDKSNLRRGTSSLFTKYGTGVAILSGDLLISKAFELINSVSVNSEECGKYLYEACLKLIEGQFKDISNQSANGLDSYYELIGEKTSAIMALPMMMLGEVNNNRAYASLLYRYAYEVSIILQLTDDFQDAYPLSDISSKSQGVDKKNKKRTIVDYVNISNESELTEEEQIKAQVENVISIHKNKAKDIILNIETSNYAPVKALDEFVWVSISNYRI